jgi:hypothetical protein
VAIWPVVQPLDDDSLAALRRAGDELLHAVEHAAFPREAEARGQMLYRALVPLALQLPLQRIEGPLLVASAVGGVPWELLHDGEEFWGVRYALARRLLDRAGEETPAPEYGPRPRILLIGSDARGDLPFVAAEVETLCVALAAIGDVVCVNGPLATFDAVTSALREGFDVVHYTGHVDTTAAGESVLVLAGETSLAAGAIQASVTGRPVVFVNGCRSVRPHGDGDGEASIAAVAHGFLRGGAAAFIGTANDVGDRFAAVLARRFYHHAAAGVPIGEALRLARGESRSDPATAGSPAWLSFALYGDPTHVPFRPRAAGAVRPPRRPAGKSPGRRLAWTAALLAVVLLVAGTAVFRRVQGRRHVVLGVMGVEVRAGQVPAWMREFTRDGIITALAEVDTVDVFSREKIDFLCEKQGLCGIAAAERLGMEAMLTPTLTVSGDTVALELQVIDVARNGVLAARERVQGSGDELIKLQNAAVLRVLEALHVTPTEIERDRILHARTDAELQAYRLLTETLGQGDAPRAPSIPAPGSLQRSPTRGVAWAQELSPDEAAVRTALEDYRARLEAKDVAGLAALQTVTTAEQRAALERYFRNARDLSIRFTRIDVLVGGDDAVATVSREDAFQDASTAKPVHLRIRMTLRLTRRDGRWKVVLPDGP